MRNGLRKLGRSAVAIGLGLLSLGAQAQAPTLGMDVIPAQGERGSVMVYYPSSAPSAAIQRGPFTLDVALQGAAQAGNRRLVVVSHGSGGAPGPFADLARTLVNAGFVVAVPEHEGDNHHDRRLVGPSSWKRRPGEVSAAIDTMKAHAVFGPLLDVDRVGVYGMSAGGLTALTLAGARWSPRNFMQHCLAHMEEDFPACVGLATSLRGNVLDPVKLTLARWVHRWQFDDEQWYSHSEPRVQAVIASVPMAAPIDMASMARPRAAVGLMQAGLDAWLAPRFHIGAVRAACTTCEVLVDLPGAGHGSFLSPWPAELAHSLTPLLVDPPGFSRQELPAVYDKMAAFFLRHLVAKR